MRPSRLVLLSLCSALPAFAAHTVTTTAVSVDAVADLFVAYGPLGGPGQPQAIDVVGKKAVSVEFTGGSVSYDGGLHVNDADGIGSASDIITTNGYGLSGISAPNAGFLAGMFIADAQTQQTPARLNFFPDHIGTDFTSLAPKLQQSFFIGDGLTGDGTGTRQKFVVPPRATRLVVGFIDACNYRGTPRMAICYADNLGSFSAIVSTYGPAAAEEISADD